MWISVLAAVLAAAPAGLALLMGLGLAVWVGLRAPAAGGVLGLGVVLLGVAEGVDLAGAIFTSTPVFFGLDPDTANWVARGIGLATSAAAWLGILAALVAACLGPAPVREEDE